MPKCAATLMLFTWDSHQRQEVSQSWLIYLGDFQRICWLTPKGHFSNPNILKTKSQNKYLLYTDFGLNLEWPPWTKLGSGVKTLRGAGILRADLDSETGKLSLFLSKMLIKTWTCWLCGFAFFTFFSCRLHLPVISESVIVVYKYVMIFRGIEKSIRMYILFIVFVQLKPDFVMHANILFRLKSYKIQF